MGHSTAPRTSSSALAGSMRSARAIACESTARRRRGRASSRGMYGSIRLDIAWLRVNSAFNRFSSREPGSQPPPGASATTERARPRRASSRAIQPPSEFPAMCAVSNPHASMSRSTASTSATTEAAVPAGSSGPPTCPASATVSTSKQDSNLARIGCHSEGTPEKPCTSTSGSPDPARVLPATTICEV